MGTPDFKRRRRSRKRGFTCVGCGLFVSRVFAAKVGEIEFEGLCKPCVIKTLSVFELEVDFDNLRIRK